MPRAPKVDENVTLPSGLVVRLTVAADPARRWSAVEIGFRWHVCRQHADASQPLVQHFFHPTRPHPLQLNEADAKALALALNRAR